MKIKPKTFDPNDPKEYQILATFYNIFAGATGLPPCYKCGTCNNLIVFLNNNRPNVCTNCGSEIDWNYTIEIKQCPKCNRQYPSSDKFCSVCTPPTELQQRIVDIPT